MIWAPLSELYGRQILFSVSFGGLTAFNAGIVGASNMWTVIILRFLAGSFGSSPLTNAGGVIADLFTSIDRGIPMAVFGSAPFLGPVSLHNLRCFYPRVIVLTTLVAWSHRWRLFRRSAGMALDHGLDGDLFGGDVDYSDAPDA